MKQYYAELYLARPGQEKEEHIGYIESWLIQKPTAQEPNRGNRWVSEWLGPDANIRDGTENDNFAHALEAFYTPQGDVNGSVLLLELELPRDQGTSPLEPDLGPQGTEMVYMPMIWIDPGVSTTPSTRWN